MRRITVWDFSALTKTAGFAMIFSREARAMYGGSSGCYGIVIYDTKKESAVYGYYENREIILKTGNRQEMLAMKARHEEGVEREKGKEGRIMGVVLAAMITLLVPLAIAASAKAFWAALIFCVISYLPILVIAFASTGIYKECELRQTFKCNHGCEHAVIYSLTNGREATVETLSKAKYLDSECGTVYSGYLIFLTLELAIMIFMEVAVLKIVAILAVTILLLFINIFNPANPFLLLQKPVVSKPSERELRLGIAIMDKLREISY